MRVRTSGCGTLGRGVFALLLAGLFPLAAAAQNTPPDLAIDPPGLAKGVDEGQALSFTATGSDLDGDGVVVTAEGLPAGAVFAGGTFSWTPPNGAAGDHEVTFTATDDGVPPLTDAQTVTISVTDVPYLSVTVSPADGGAVTADGEIDCPAGACGAFYPGGGATAHLVATPGAGRRFLFRWEGDASGNAGTVDLPMTGDRAVNAVFAKVTRVCSSADVDPLCSPGDVQGSICSAGTGDVIEVKGHGTIDSRPCGRFAGIHIPPDQAPPFDGVFELTIRGIGTPESAWLAVLPPSASPVVDVGAEAGLSVLLRLENLTLNGGGTDECGGGLRVSASGPAASVRVELRKVLLSGSYSVTDGGGLCVEASDGGSAEADLENVLILGNVVSPGGIRVDAGGGGFAVRSEGAGSLASLRMRNTTVTQNLAFAQPDRGGFRVSASGGAAATVEAYDSVVWGSFDLYGSGAAQGLLEESSGGEVAMSLHGTIMAPPEVGVGAAYSADPSLTEAPVFQAPATTQYPLPPKPTRFRLNADSPGIDAADPLSVPAEDLLGRPRPLGAGGDLGALEAPSRRYRKLKLLFPTGAKDPLWGIYNIPTAITWGAPKSLRTFRVYWSRNDGRTWRLVGTARGAARHIAWDPPGSTGDGPRDGFRVMVKGYDRAGVLRGVVASRKSFTVY